jgi:hypothetical protein
MSRLIAVASAALLLALPAPALALNRWRVVRPYNAKLERMAQCESTGRWYIATGNGFYGGLQFTLSTWWSVGGRGYPHRNSELEQKYRAVLLIRRAGYAPWPVCGYR